MKTLIQYYSDSESESESEDDEAEGEEEEYFLFFEEWLSEVDRFFTDFYPFYAGKNGIEKIKIK